MSRRYWGAAAGVLVAEAALLAWNAWHYDWLRGYDAFANERYADVVSREYRLPSEAESGVWHTPPLWFALAGALGRLTTALGLGHAQRPGQLLAAAAGLVTCVLVLLLARVLWPERPVLHLVALVFVAASPALVRASAMYHPETLAVALATGGVLVAVRALRTRWTIGSAAAAGALLGLACLTRAWAFPVLVAVLVVAGLHAWDTRRWMPVAACAAVALALFAPWLVNQQLAHGSALAFNRPPPSGSLLERRPASFYLGPRSLRALEHPITPLFRNELVPHLYADWWGDWALTWDSPPPPRPPRGGAAQTTATAAPPRAGRARRDPRARAPTARRRRPPVVHAPRRPWTGAAPPGRAAADCPRSGPSHPTSPRRGGGRARCERAGLSDARARGASAGRGRSSPGAAPAGTGTAADG